MGPWTPRMGSRIVDTHNIIVLGLSNIQLQQYNWNLGFAVSSACVIWAGEIPAANLVKDIESSELVNFHNIIGQYYFGMLSPI